jgi:hypothetical protein
MAGAFPANLTNRNRQFLAALPAIPVEKQLYRVSSEPYENMKKTIRSLFDHQA